MARFLALIANFIGIAIAGSVAAWVTVVAIFALERADKPITEIWIEVYTGMFWVGLAGNFVVGLPVAVLVYALARKQMVQAPAILAMISVLSGVMLILASFVVGDARAALIFGLPAFASAITFGVVGYLFLIRPHRTSGKIVNV